MNHSGSGARSTESKETTGVTAAGAGGNAGNALVRATAAAAMAEEALAIERTLLSYTYCYIKRNRSCQLVRNR